MATVTVAGSLAQRPDRGGHAWVFLNYLLGLRRLGHDVLFVDRLEPDMVEPGLKSLNESPQARWLATVMAAAGLADRYLLLTAQDSGLSHSDHHSDALARLNESDLLINVNGFLRDEELLAAPAATAFIDIDPAIQHMWTDMGLAECFGGHDFYFTVGENIGRSGCNVPTCGLDWVPTRQPVDLAEWQVRPCGRAFTTVATWRGPYDAVEYRGEIYGLRVHEFRPLLALAGRVDECLCIALDIDPADEADVAALDENGWRVADPIAVAGRPEAYRTFIQASKAEISVAKGVYVGTKCGWFSDRSACYLAGGRPVVAQDTGFSEHLPTGRGLMAFRTIDEAANAIEEVSRDWQAHSKAARAIAEEYFDARVVLQRILDVAGI